MIGEAPATSTLSGSCYLRLTQPWFYITTEYMKMVVVFLQNIFAWLVQCMRQIAMFHHLLLDFCSFDDLVLHNFLEKLSHMDFMRTSS